MGIRKGSKEIFKLSLESQVTVPQEEVGERQGSEEREQRPAGLMPAHSVTGCAGVVGAATEGQVWRILYGL